jgi:hypothetical protein
VSGDGIEIVTLVWPGDGEAAQVERYSERALPGRWSSVTTARGDGVVGLEEAQVGLKRTLWEGDRIAVAVQGTLDWRAQDWRFCGGAGGELRVMAGRSVGRRGFVNGELSWRAEQGGCSGAKFDVTAGWRPNERWILLGQVFRDQDLSPAFRERPSLKLQGSAVRVLKGGLGFQAGLRAALDEGDQASIGPVLGVWIQR